MSNLTAKSSDWSQTSSFCWLCLCSRTSSSVTKMKTSATSRRRTAINTSRSKSSSPCSPMRTSEASFRRIASSRWLSLWCGSSRTRPSNWQSKMVILRSWIQIFSAHRSWSCCYQFWLEKSCSMTITRIHSMISFRMPILTRSKFYWHHSCTQTTDTLKVLVAVQGHTSLWLWRRWSWSSSCLICWRSTSKKDKMIRERPTSW